MSRSTRPDRAAVGWRRTVSIVVASMVALVGSLALTGPASAAEVPVQVSNPELSGDLDDLGVGDWLRFEADLTTPPGSIVNAGDTFTVTLPPALRLVSSAPFEMTDASGEVVAECVYEVGTDPQNLVCTFTNDEPIQDWAGSIWFQVAVRNVQGEVDLTFTVNDTVTVPFEGTIGTGPTGPTEPSDFDKGSGIDTSYRYINWGVSIPSTKTAELRGLTTVTITDDLVNDDAEFKPHAIDPASFRFVRYPVSADGGFSWDEAQVVDAASFDVVFRGPADAPTGYTITTTGSIFEAGYYYRVEYRTNPVGGVYIPGDKYKNDAEIAGNAVTSSSTVQAYGGGAGDGARYVDFTITKVVEGEAASSLPAGTTFTVVASAPGHADRVLEVVDGGLAQSGYYPVGTTITVTEGDLPSVPGIEWGDFSVTGAGVTDNGDGTYSITPTGGTTAVLTLTNVANPVGSVSVGDYVWFDRNRDGVQDPDELPIPGVTLTLTGPDGQPVTDVDGQPVPPTVTDADGKYLFPNLPILATGGYTVTVTPPAGYEATTPGTTARDRDSSTSSATSLPLPNDGDSDLTLDFGFVEILQPGGFAITKVFDDVADLVPDDHVFEVSYVVTSPEGVAGEPQTLQLSADGTVVGVSGLPAGSTVHFEEINLPVLAGYTWNEPEISANDVVIAPSCQTAVPGEPPVCQDPAVIELTNSYAPAPAGPNPTQSPTPSTAPTPIPSSTSPAPSVPARGPNLPSTGAGGVGLGLAVAGGLALAGAGVLLVRRRRVEG